MTYFDKIDPIGEHMGEDSQTPDPIDELMENCSNRNTEINNLKKEVKSFGEIIKDYQTYSDNVYMLKNLQGICQRMKTHVESLEKHNNWINNEIDKNFDYGK